MSKWRKYIDRNLRSDDFCNKIVDQFDAHQACLLAEIEGAEPYKKALKQIVKFLVDNKTDNTFLSKDGKLYLGDFVIKNIGDLINDTVSC